MTTRRRRLIGILGGIGFTVLCGWGLLYGLNKSCADFSPESCYLLWGTAAVSIVGGVFLLEVLVAQSEALNKRKSHMQESPGDERPGLTASQNWFRSVVRVVLSSLLALFPAIVQGAFAVAVAGTFTGLFLGLFFRGVLNRLPVVEQGDR